MREEKKAGRGVTIWLVRHAQPDIAGGICYGHLDMPALAPATADCASALDKALPVGLQVISSPLRRCIQLADALQSLRPGLQYQIDSRLREMHFGEWEGQAWSLIPKSDMDAWTANFAHHQAGGNGESVANLMQRVSLALADAIDSGIDTIWITHAGVIRAAELLSKGIRNIERADQWPVSGLGYGQWRTLGLTIP